MELSNSHNLWCSCSYIVALVWVLSFTSEVDTKILLIAIILSVLAKTPFSIGSLPCVV